MERLRATTILLWATMLATVLTVAAAPARAGLKLATKDLGYDNPKPGPDGERDYRRFNGGAPMQKVEEALQDICPCLFIKVARRNHRGNQRRGTRPVTSGEVIVRDPRADRSDLPPRMRGDGVHRDSQIYCEKGKRTKRCAERGECFCSCYCENKAGCNLLLSLAQSETDTVIWDVPPGGGGNRHSQGDVKWNPGRKRGGRQSDGDTRRDPSVGLAHELAHAYHHAVGGRGAQRLDEEFRTVRAENQIRTEMRRRLERRRDQSRNRRFTKRQRQRHDRLDRRDTYVLDGTEHTVPAPEGSVGAIDATDRFGCCGEKVGMGLFVPESELAYDARTGSLETSSPSVIGEVVRGDGDAQGDPLLGSMLRLTGLRVDGLGSDGVPVISSGVMEIVDPLRVDPSGLPLVIGTASIDAVELQPDGGLLSGRIVDFRTTDADLGESPLAAALREVGGEMLLSADLMGASDGLTRSASGLSGTLTIVVGAGRPLDDG